MKGLVVAKICTDKHPVEIALRKAEAILLEANLTIFPIGTTLRVRDTKTGKEYDFTDNEGDSNYCGVNEFPRPFDEVLLKIVENWRYFPHKII